jgi:Protein of unknown function (DUF1203)
MISFQFSALPQAKFANLFSKNDQELAALGIRRVMATANTGFPCRVSLIDASIGEELLLMPYIHHDVDSPYRASGPIYVRKNAIMAMPAPNETPAVIAHRLLSLRCYDQTGMMLEAQVLEGEKLSETLPLLFENQSIEYIHIHNAKPGCFSCSVRRA